MHSRLSHLALTVKALQPLEVAQLQRLELLQLIHLLAHREASDKAQLSLPNLKKRREKKNRAVLLVVN